MTATDETTTNQPSGSDIASLGRAARAASRVLAQLSRADKDTALLTLADAIVERTEQIVAANESDLDRGRMGGMSESLLDRLRMTPERVEAVAQGLRDVAALADPVGEIVRGNTLANGLQIRQVRVPMGVIGMIYEARPNVTVDAAGLGLKSGNAMILRGGSAAAETNAALVDTLRSSLVQQGLPADAVQLMSGGREDVTAMITARGLIDLVIPRGGASLIETVVTQSTVPVIETGTGNVHVYVDKAADLDMAAKIAVNSKTHRPSVCNAAENLLVHADVADAFLPRVMNELQAQGVSLFADDAASSASGGVPTQPVTDEAWNTEFLDLQMAVGVVKDIDEAIAHIERYTTRHTECIVTEDRAAARKFVAEVDAAVVMVNASTRFTDGGEFGFGAEIGISTQKLHARGPMALAELTTTKWIVDGDGQVRA